MKWWILFKMRFCITFLQCAAVTINGSLVAVLILVASVSVARAGSCALNPSCGTEDNCDASTALLEWFDDNPAVVVLDGELWQIKRVGPEDQMDEVRIGDVTYSVAGAQLAIFGISEVATFHISPLGSDDLVVLTKTATEPTGHSRKTGRSIYAGICKGLF